MDTNLPIHERHPYSQRSHYSIQNGSQIHGSMESCLCYGTQHATFQLIVSRSPTRANTANKRTKNLNKHISKSNRWNSIMLVLYAAERYFISLIAAVQTYTRYRRRRVKITSAFQTSMSKVRDDLTTFSTLQTS